MDNSISFFNELATGPRPILDASIPMDAYKTIDLSKDNPEIKGVKITDPLICQDYITQVLYRTQGKVAYGGYLEQRNLYADKTEFTGSAAPKRDIHLGIDFWCHAGTEVIVPYDGEVHSFKNNATIGDYGPTIVLKHLWKAQTFYSLYGHLSLASLNGLYKSKQFKAGDTLAKLGTPDINVNYAPHLHFQIILNMEGKEGDYPGVCSKDRLEFYTQNCPNPNLLLGIT